MPQTTRREEINPDHQPSGAACFCKDRAPAPAVITGQVAALSTAPTLLMSGQSSRLWAWPQSLASFLWTIKVGTRARANRVPARTSRRALTGSLVMPHPGALGPGFGAVTTRESGPSKHREVIANINLPQLPARSQTWRPQGRPRTRPGPCFERPWGARPRAQPRGWWGTRHQ